MNPFAAVVGALYPPDRIAAKIVRETLIGGGLDPALYPVAALSSYSVRLAKLKASVMRDWYRTHLFEAASGVAHIAIFITIGHSDWAAKTIRAEVERGAPNPVWELLANHDPERFSLEYLQHTQAAHAKA